MYFKLTFKKVEQIYKINKIQKENKFKIAQNSQNVVIFRPHNVEKEIRLKDTNLVSKECKAK
jgi:hypothetical protein